MKNEISFMKSILLFLSLSSVLASSKLHGNSLLYPLITYANIIELDFSFSIWPGFILNTATPSDLISSSLSLVRTRFDSLYYVDSF